MSQEQEAIARGEDPICNVCCERLSTHVATDEGPYTHPREARGEGRYQFLGRSYFGLSCSTCGGVCEGHDRYSFVPATKLANPYGHGWSPYDVR